MFEFIDIINPENDVADNALINAELELYFSMNESQLLHINEPELGLFAVESPMVIERVLMAGYEPRSFVMIDSIAEEICARFGSIMKEWNNPPSLIPVYTADYETIAGMTGVNITRGVLALMKRKTLLGITELVKDYNRIAVFDDVENPTNVGAMFRSAAALGIEAVILSGASSDPLYRRASRVSVGTVFQVPWTKVTNKKTFGKCEVYSEAGYINELHSLGFKTAAMALSDNSIGVDAPCLKAEERLAIILGNEGKGLPEEVINSSDYVVKIPMKNGVDSLNVAAASSVIFWEILKK